MFQMLSKPINSSMFKYIRTPLFLLFVPFMSYFVHGFGLSNFNNFDSGYKLYSQITSANYLVAILMVILISISTKTVDTLHLYVRILVIGSVLTTWFFYSLQHVQINGITITHSSLFFFELIYLLFVIIFFIQEYNRK